MCRHLMLQPSRLVRRLVGQAAIVALVGQAAIVALVDAVAVPALVGPGAEALIHAKATQPVALSCSKKRFSSIGAPKW